MFTELMPLLAGRTVLITVARVDDKTLRVNIVPAQAKADENPALTTPLTCTGSPEELDAELGKHLASYVEVHQQAASSLAEAKATMEAAAEGVQDRLVQSGISLNIRAAPDIGSFVADERRVRQTLFNLLANAIGFSPAGETVTLAAQRLKDAVIFSVTDHGPGIPADVQDKVFDWFETHSLGSRHRGTGLGLSLVRSFVELHGGKVQVDSVVGKGTTVTCDFPIDQNAHRNAAE